MSKIYDTSFKVLKTILKEKDFFTVALKKNSNGIKKEELTNISSLCGLFLRNYYFIENIAQSIFETKDTEPVIYIGLAYVNNAFKNIVDKTETIKYLENKLALYQIKFESDRKDSFAKAVTDKKMYLKEIYTGKEKHFGYRFLSARNNLPEWVVKTLVKQYDRDISMKTINAMTKMPKQFAVVNSLYNPEKIDEALKDFVLKEGDLYEYPSTSSIRKNPYVRSGHILPLQVAEYQFFKALPTVENGSVSYYFEEKEALYSLISKKYLEKNKVSLISPSQKSNQELFAKINPNKPENLDIYASDINGIVTHISERQDLIVYMPKSSNLELLRRTPEYGILFDTNDLDGVIKHELEGLEEIIQYVKEDGYVAYAVSTFNIKETLVLSKMFLNAHPEFTLEKERIYFPYEKENSVFYYAIFKRK